MAKKKIDLDAVMDQDAVSAAPRDTSEDYRQLGFQINASADLALGGLVAARKQAGDRTVTTTSLLIEAINLLFAKEGIEAQATIRPRGRR